MARLTKLGLSAERLGEQAMSSPHVDMVQKAALWLTSFEQNDNANQTANLTDNQANSQANQQLQNLLQTNSPVLTQQAYRLLVKRVEFIAKQGSLRGQLLFAAA